MTGLEHLQTLSTIADNAEIRRNSKAVYRELADGTGGVLTVASRTEYHGLNPMGALIWELLDDGPTFRELIGRLQAQLDGVPDTFVHEISDFVHNLEAHELVEIDGLSGASPGVDDSRLADDLNRL